MGGIPQKSYVTLFLLWGKGGGGQNRYVLTEILEKYKVEI